MGLKDLHRKFKAFKMSRSIARVGESNEKKASWMTPISHGFQVVEGSSSCNMGEHASQPDVVAVQREQIQELEVWFFGVSDAGVGDKITKYLHTHLFSKGLTKNQIRKRSKETLKKAYTLAKSKVTEGRKGNERMVSSDCSAASVIVINGEKIVAASMGEYRAVVSRDDGVAHEICERYQRKRAWNFNLIISGALRMHRRQRFGSSMASRSSRKMAVGVEKIDSNTEFLILGSSGVWEVMKIQEAVNLIWHIDDPKEAAECLAREALTRMSRDNISCLVIRFD